jgi:hypothetical protein
MGMECLTQLARKLAATLSICHVTLREGTKELLFVNKKKQKNVTNFRAGRLQHRAKRSKKVFWFFFSKKNFLILLSFFLLEPS